MSTYGSRLSYGDGKRSESGGLDCDGGMLGFKLLELIWVRKSNVDSLGLIEDLVSLYPRKK